MEYVCKVVRKRDLTPSVFELAFVSDRPLDFKAGQYVSIVVPHQDKPLRRPYSIASAPGQDPIELCIQRIDRGPGNTFLSGLEAGDTFSAFAPYGFLVYHPKTARDCVFVSTGTGIAPFRSMILSREFQEKPPRSTLCLLGVRIGDEILYQESLGALPGVKWITCLSRDHRSEPTAWKGRVTDYLREHAEQIQWAETDFYLCGNGAMIDEVKSLLKEKGVTKDSIHQEIYFKPPKSS